MLRGLDGLNTLIYDLIKVEESPAFTNPIFEIRPFVIKNIKFSINSVNDSVEQTIYSKNLKPETESECDYVIIQEVDITDQLDDKNAQIPGVSFFVAYFASPFQHGKRRLNFIKNA